MIPDPSSFLDAPAWLLALIDVAMRVTLILFAAGAAALAFNRAAANTRHFIWQLGVVACLLVPMATWLLPRVEWKVLPAQVAPPAPSPSFELPARSFPTTRSQWAAWDDVRPRAVPAAWTRAPIGDTPVAPLERGTWSLPKLRIDQWLLLVWIAGVFAVLEWTLVDRIRVFFLAQRSRDVVDERRDVFTQQVLRLGVPGPVRFVEADIELPMTWGIVEATVAVPISSREWPAERMEAVLLHELAHVRRRDTLTQFLAQLACAAYWFHPMVWFAARQLRVLREYACDDEVIDHGVRPSSYAEELLQLVQNVKRRDSLSGATLAMARRSHFKERLFAMLDPAVRRARLARTRAWSMAALALVLTASFVVVQPAAAEPKPGGTLPRLTPKQSSQRQINAPPEAAAAPTPPVPVAPRLPRVTAPSAPEAAEAPEAPEAPEAACDQGEGESEGSDEVSVRAKIAAAVKSSRDDSSLATALKRIAHEEDLDEEATRQAYLAAMAPLKDDLARWIALEGLLVGAPISEQTGAGVMKEAKRFSRDAERVAFLHRMHTIREDELVRGPFTSDYLDVAAKLQSQEALSDALRELLHPSPVEQAGVERALGMASSLDGDLLAPVMIEVTDHQQLTGNVPTLYAALAGKLDGRLKEEAMRRWSDAVADGGNQSFWKKFAFNGSRNANRDAQREYQRAMRDAQRQQARDLAQQAKDLAQQARDEEQMRRDMEAQARDEAMRETEQEYARQLEQLERNKERLKERAMELKNEAIQLKAQMKELKKNLKVKVKTREDGDVDVDVDVDDSDF